MRGRIQQGKIIPNIVLQQAKHLQVCPLCCSSRVAYRFINQGIPIAQCEECELLFSNPQISREYQHELMSNHSGLSTFRSVTSKLYFEQLRQYRGKSAGALLVVGVRNEDIVQEARSQGFTTTTIEFSPTCDQDLEKLRREAYLFDVCMLVYTLEKMSAPVECLQNLHALLKPDGVLFLVTPSLDSWSARLLKKNWFEFRAENLFYFDCNTIRNLLYKTHFHKLSIIAEKRLTALNRIQKRLSPFGNDRELMLAASGMVILATPNNFQSSPKLSIIVPVFNEKPTFSILMNELVQKTIPGLETEIVIVESNSIDGTREDVIKYQDHPFVKVVFQDHPKGKGFAVRTGFDHITGDFVLIQDADLEYDLNDYEDLLRPLMKYQATFIIGSRHTLSGWKIREFNDARWLSLVYNFGHVMFLSLLNILYNQDLRDPFSMYKVFRRDCLYGLQFECNRFDFDFELVIKLIRNGCKPFEIPVNYRSRSHKEGKKVSIVRDPLTWLKALIKYRITRL